MAEYYSIFGPNAINISFDICFEVKYFDLEPSYIRFAYYLTWIPELRYKPQQPISNRDPVLPKFGSKR